MSRGTWLTGVALGSALIGTQAQAAPRSLHYEITPERVAGQLADLRIRLALPARAGATYTLDLPDGVVAHLAPSGFSIEGGEKRDPAKPVGNRLALKATAARLVVTYRLLSDGAKTLRADDQGMAIHANWFSLRGDEALITPVGARTGAATVTLTPLPEWTLTSSVDGAVSLADIGDSQFVGGVNYRVMARTVDGVPFRLTYPESFAAKAQALMNDATTIVTAERHFWGTPGKPVYIGLVELDDDGNVSGRGLHDGLSLYLGAGVDRKTWVRLIAHENLHGWISRAIGGFPATDSDLEAWLNEGFTEAYTARLLLSSGLWTPQDYIDDWNLSLARYGTSPVKTAPNHRILADRQTDFDVNKLPYDRGRLLAVIWDKTFRERTQGRTGLSDVLRAQMVEAARHGQDPQMSADRLFPTAAKRLTGVDLGPDIDRFVDKGDALVLAPGTFGACVNVQDVTQPVFDRGFDLDATFHAHGHVAGLEAGGPADKAGLKAGDKIRIDEIPTHDSRVTLSYRVDDGGGQSHWVRYHPEGATTVTFQQLSLKPGGSPDCVRAVP